MFDSHTLSPQEFVFNLLNATRDYGNGGEAIFDWYVSAPVAEVAMPDMNTDVLKRHSSQ